jgi:hypothetical protein
MDARQQRELVDALLDCQSMSDRNIRDSVVSNLRDEIRRNIERSTTDHDDMANIVRRCLRFSDGLEELVAIVRGYDSGSIAMQDVDRLLLRIFDFDIDRDEPYVALLAIVSRVNVPVSELKAFYRSLLPDGNPEREEPLGPFAMLSHMWNLSRRTGTQTRTRTYPIIDFVEQIARKTGDRRVASELREWSDQVASILFQGGGSEVGVAARLEEASQAPDHRRLTILASVLAYLYPTVEASGEVVANARLNPVGIDFLERPLPNWQNILSKASTRDKTRAIIEAAIADHPANQWLRLALHEQGPQAASPRAASPRAASPRTATPKSLSPRGADEIPQPVHPIPVGWPRDIVFLEQGISAARPVCRVKLPISSATGFLIAGNLLITGSFVIGTREQAREAVVQFDFQRTAGDLYAPLEEFELAPEEGFVTSSADMWTAVCVRGDANHKWGALPLDRADPRPGDLLSMVHHGLGKPKQIELLNSAVVSVAGKRIQSSLQVKQPGSAGAPVFDLNWDVIAMHYAAGKMPDSASGQPAMRREAIHINAIIGGLQAAGLYTEP